MSRKSHSEVLKRINAFLDGRPDLARNLAVAAVEGLMLDDIYDLLHDEHDYVDGADFMESVSCALFGNSDCPTFHDLFVALSPPPKYEVEVSYTVVLKKGQVTPRKTIRVPSKDKNVLRHFLMVHHPNLAQPIDEDSITILDSIPCKR